MPGSADSRLARALPAEPPPTMMKSYFLQEPSALPGRGPARVPPGTGWRPRSRMPGAPWRRAAPAASHNSGISPDPVAKCPVANCPGRQEHRRAGYPAAVVSLENQPAPSPGHDPHPGETAYRQTRFRLPPGATEILLIRHGESAAAYLGKPFPLVDGHADPELAENGREQAERLAEGSPRPTSTPSTSERRCAAPRRPPHHWRKSSASPRRSSRTCARSTWASGKRACSARWSPTITRSPSGCGPRNGGT